MRYHNDFQLVMESYHYHHSLSRGRIRKQQKEKK